jgi:hypothetical protein
LRILRLTNSNDLLGNIPAELRGAAVAERVVAEATGEPVETVQRVVWPGPELPAIVERWLANYQPDVVFIRIPAFWICYESVPLRLQRRLGPLGYWPGRLGLKIGGNPGFAASRFGKTTRKLLLRTIGGDAYFTPQQVTLHVEAVLRTVLAKESVVPAVRGPGHSINSAGTARGLARAVQRSEQLDALLAAACSRLHVAYVSARAVGHDSSFLLSDELHDGPEGQRLYGEVEGRLIASAWLETLRPGVEPR